MSFKPGFDQKFDYYFDRCSEAILFGSFAMERDTKDSDVDILFVSDEKSYKDNDIDFICIPPEKLKLKSWLGSELANHISKYGIWLKGAGGWKQSVFVSKNATDRKKIKILSRLSHIWVTERNAEYELLFLLFLEVILDCYRLVLLEKDGAVPATAIINDIYKGDTENILEKMSADKYLGPIFDAYIMTLFPNLKSLDVNEMIRSSLKERK